MKRFGSGLVIVAVAVLLASLFAARAIPRQDLLPQTHEMSPCRTVIDETTTEEPIDPCSPIPPKPNPTPTVSMNRPTLAPPPPSSLATQTIYERHPRGQAITVRVEAEELP